MTFLPVILIVFALALLLGAWLIIRGLRGDRVGDHPYCRHCGFDLVGLPEGSERCSECGADLSRHRAIVIGQRKRRAAQVTLGTMLLVPVIGVAAFAASSTNFDSYKPVLWLRLEADHGGPRRASDALRQLTRRVESKALTGDALDRLVVVALARQADMSCPWRSGWADLIESAWIEGRVSSDQWRQYARNALGSVVSLRVRPRVTRGEPIPFYIVLGGSTWRGTTTGSTRLNVELLDHELNSELGGARGSGSKLSLNSFYAASEGGTRIQPTAAALGAAADGAHKLAGIASLTIASSPSDPSQRAKVNIPLSASFTLLPINEPSVVERHDPAQLLAVQRALSVDQVSVQFYGGRASVMIRVASFAPPVALALNIEAVERHTGKRVHVGSLILPAGARVSYSFGDDLPDDLLDAIRRASNKIDVVLTPSRKIAVESIDVTEYWRGDAPIVFEDVPVNMPGD